MVAAVGFLGAGAIFRNNAGDSVSGLTTAASLLMVAAIGIAAGLHALLLALQARTVLTLCHPRGAVVVEHRIGSRKP